MIKNIVFLQQLFHQTLIVGVVALVAYNIWVWQQPRMDVDAWLGNIKGSHGYVKEVQIVLPNVKPYRLYEKTIVERNPFEPVALSEDDPVAERMSVLKTLPNHLNIVGVVLDEKKGPELVIEDTQSKKTIFLIQGETIEELNLHHIDKDVIRLQYRGKIYEVPLNP